MRSVEMKNRCLLYYGNPVGYRTEQGVVADSMFRREELEDWLARKGLAVRWEDGIYDRLSSGGYQKAAPTVWMGSGRHSVAGPWAATDSRWPSQTLSNSTTIPAASSTMWTAQLSSPSN